jgi:hypothetical protein
MKFTRKQKFLYFALAPFALVLVLTLIPVSGVQVFAAACWYSTLFGWLVYLIFLWIRWIARTAEGAGRSYGGFMIFGIFLPVIASIVVLTFKQDKSPSPDESASTEEKI